jgi:hypothetical protein
MNSEVKVTFDYEQKTIRDPLFLGEFESDQESDVFKLNIKHNSNKPIRDCSFYVSEYENIYAGSNTSKSDIEKLSWYANNFEEYGLSLRQQYEVYGTVSSQDGGRLVDTSRFEEADIFAGSEVEMLSGPVAGEKRLITSYNYDNSLFIIESDFSVPTTNERYKINIEKLDYIKSKNGTSTGFSIPLLYNAGKIDRFETASVSLQLKVPPFMRNPGISYVNLNMKYTPEE